MPTANGGQANGYTLVYRLMFNINEGKVIWPSLGQALRKAQQRDNTSFLLRPPSPASYDFLNPNVAVECVDKDYPRDPALLKRQVTRNAELAPLLGPAMAYGPPTYDHQHATTCVQWTGEKPSRYDGSISYATSKGIGLFLYVNRLALTDADSLFGLYKSWGVQGIKLGFINDGTQSMTNQIIDWAKAAAKYELLIDMHDDVRPFGYERTYPNWISLEGVRGNEQFPTATHNVTLPFARNIGGPMDYTICYGQSRDKTTNAHQMAMAAVYYQPLNFLFWYDKPSKYGNPANWPGLPWFNAVPVTWDESRTLAGAIGEYIAVARRSGSAWYLGAMTDESSRTLSLPLSFLGSGTYTATVYADGTPGTSPFRTPVVVSTRTVTAADTLDVAMAPAGGQAVVLKPS
ncbi:hypothetical protein SVIOM74S_05308 [Streptomyces violarus]